MRVQNTVLRAGLGAKADDNQIHFSTGGGATNAAVTFSRQGHYASFMGAIGHDPAGQAVIADLDKENIDTHLVRIFTKIQYGIFSFTISLKWRANDFNVPRCFDSLSRVRL